MTFNTLSGIVIHYEEKGVGAPLLLLPPKGFDPWIWQEQIETLSKCFRLIMIKWPRTTDIQYGNESMTVEDLANSLAELLDSIAEDAVHVLGVGLGGQVAQTLAVYHPEILDRVILSSTARTSPDFAVDENEILSIYVRTGFESNFATLEAATELELYPCNRVDLIRDITVKKSKLFPDKRSYQELLLAEAAFNLEDYLGMVKSDTLVVIGDQDKVVSRRIQLSLCEAIPGAKDKTIENAGHLSFLTAPEKFNRAVIEFLLG